MTNEEQADIAGRGQSRSTSHFCSVRHTSPDESSSIYQHVLGRVCNRQADSWEECWLWGAEVLLADLLDLTFTRARASLF
mmetsp:Transcript_14076/g.30514  ORF Transcript_14076/g.30514 Transcript_14076/m.30514 type:complete len:80 (+) Transcript_14076:1655-1894(+)